MKIIKRFQGQAPENKILNYISDSETDGYSCAIINGMSIPIDAIVDYDGDEVPEGYEEVPDYSTTEQRIGTWINGKPIYRRVFTGTLGNSEANVVTNELRSDRCQIIKAYGSIADNNNDIPIGHYVNDAWASGVWTNASYLYLYVTSSLFNKPYELVVEYTKTTD